MPIRTHINALESAIYEMKKDTSVPAKYRNKATARIEEAQAWLSKAILDDPNYGAPMPGEEGKTPFECICPSGAVDRGCPLHGTL